MPVLNSSAEVVVIGAGPAGCAAARRLALLGHDVLMIDRGGPCRPAVVETAPAVLPSLLLGIGCAADEAAGVSLAAASRVRWGSAAEASAAALPCLLDRAPFDEALRKAALVGGVRVMTAAARVPARMADGRWCVPLHDGSSLLAGAVVLAGGRGGRAEHDQPRTVALCGLWHGLPPGLPSTSVESAPHGWAWVADAGDGRAAAVLFVGVEQVVGVDASMRLHRYLSGLVACPLVHAVLARGRAPDSVRVADATARQADPVVAPGLVRAGDAAHCLDPLSAQGVVAALRSGVQAGVALHTALRRPTNAALAWRFMREQHQRERELHRRWCADSYLAARNRWESPFWCQRGNDVSSVEATVAGPPPSLDHPVALDARARLSHGPRLEGDWIVAAPLLEHPGLPTPIGFVAGRSVLPLAAQAQRAQPLGELLRRWNVALGAPQAVALAQDWWRAGLLVSADQAAPTAG